MLEILSILENNNFIFVRTLIENILEMDSDDVIGLPGPLWSQRVKLPRDVSYYMDWTSIEPGEILSLERVALQTAKSCNERMAFLASPPTASFGVISDS